MIAEAIAAVAAENVDRVAEITHFAITEAEDWPMLKFMLGIVGGVFFFLWGIIVLLVGLVYRGVVRKIDLNHAAIMARISTQRKEDSEHCQECNKGTTAALTKIWKHIDKAIWKAIESCCPRIADQAAKQVREELSK